jgi:hypothetical protein
MSVKSPETRASTRATPGRRERYRTMHSNTVNMKIQSSNDDTGCRTALEQRGIGSELLQCCDRHHEIAYL